MEGCTFAGEIKEYVLQTKEDVIGHYYYIRNWLMCSEEKYLKKRPEFSACKEEVLDEIGFL